MVFVAAALTVTGRIAIAHKMAVRPASLADLRLMSLKAAGRSAAV